MKCDLCEGQYLDKAVVRSYKRRGKTIIVEAVPALVCDRCGDTLIREETVAALDALLSKDAKPRKYAPVYRFRAKVA
ncbi:MAG: YgiT-type zinc finger protein [Dehalococcoidia bacterium]|nr:YgiT-type zinc finger protein [Dehalococcoidia bacterium]